MARVGRLLRVIRFAFISPATHSRRFKALIIIAKELKEEITKPHYCILEPKENGQPGCKSFQYGRSRIMSQDLLDIHSANATCYSFFQKPGSASTINNAHLVIIRQNCLI